MKELNWNRGQEAPQPVTRTRFGGQWEYHFNYNVQQDGDEYRWLSAVTPAGMWDKGAVIRAIIRQRYTADDVEAINCNILNAPTDETRMAEYLELQRWRTMAKQCAKEAIAWGETNGVCEESGSESHSEDPDVQDDMQLDGLEQMIQAMTLARMQVVELPDEKAVDVLALFPSWVSRIGTVLNAGERLNHKRRLWKVLQNHTAQSDWMPDTTPSLFAEVAADQEQGTIDNPIPYNGNMALEEGKYYTQGGVVYLCIRDTINPVYNDLSALVGLYVQIVE